jgi:integrase
VQLLGQVLFGDQTFFAGRYPPSATRHTFATLMLEQGENPKVIQEILGNSQIAHTMDTYSTSPPTSNAKPSLGWVNDSSSLLSIAARLILLSQFAKK